MFSDQDKKIYPYRAKGKDLKGDPVAIWRKLARLLGGEEKINETIDAFQGEYVDDKGQVLRMTAEPALEAGEMLANAVCVAFGLGQPWDAEKGQGVLEEEWRGVICDFLEWLEKNDQTVETSATSSEPSAPVSADSVITTSAVSCSISNEPEYAAPVK